MPGNPIHDDGLREEDEDYGRSPRPISVVPYSPAEQTCSNNEEDKYAGPCDPCVQLVRWLEQFKKTETKLLTTVLKVPWRYENSQAAMWRAINLHASAAALVAEVRRQECVCQFPQEGRGPNTRQRPCQPSHIPPERHQQSQAAERQARVAGNQPQAAFGNQPQVAVGIQPLRPPNQPGHARSQGSHGHLNMPNPNYQANLPETPEPTLRPQQLQKRFSAHSGNSSNSWSQQYPPTQGQGYSQNQGYNYPPGGSNQAGAAGQPSLTYQQQHQVWAQPSQGHSGYQYRPPPGGPTQPSQQPGGYNSQQQAEYGQPPVGQ